MRSELENLSKELGVQDRVHFLGYIKDEDLPTLYRAGDMFVLPTRELEGFGLVAIEAMAPPLQVCRGPVHAQ